MCLALSGRVRDEGDLLGYAAAAGIIGAIALYRLLIRREQNRNWLWAKATGPLQGRGGSVRARERRRSLRRPARAAVRDARGAGSMDQLRDLASRPADARHPADNRCHRGRAQM